MNNSTLFFLSLFCLISSSHLYLAGAKQTTGNSTASKNPFSPKAALIRYWNKRIHGDSPKSAFLLSKASPLTAVDSASFASLASRHALHTRLRDFCSAAKLFCFPELSPSLHNHGNDVNFAVYNNKNFTTYGSDRLAGTDSFKNYSSGDNNIAVVGSFRRYGRDSAGHQDGFSNYAKDVNIADQSFRSYGSRSTGGSGDFMSYQNQVNKPASRFTSYSGDANGRSQSFMAYSVNSNDGVQTFTSYSKNGNDGLNGFSGYGSGSNVIQSSFSEYSRSANAANATFTTYGMDGNIPANEFRSYGQGGNGAAYSFKSYRDKANMGSDSFSSYAINSNTEKVNFVNYANSFNLGSDNFTSYGQGAVRHKVGFKTYRQNRNFKEYSRNDVFFARYINERPPMARASGKTINKWVEPGKFFRESTLKEGNLIQMPDIKDKMPKRMFLPQAIVSKLPFSTSDVHEITRIFGASENSTAAKTISATLKECERAPSRGETKRCVGSAEDLIDFATSVLGHHVAIITTENVRGSKSQVMIGKIKGINGGNVTISISCHQSMYPYLLYYCHSVPRVRVYEVDILDPNGRVKINHGVAICHLDTSAWSPGHGAFLVLGSGPGQIEVCHWIYENDMSWTVAE